METKKFKDFGIKPALKGLEGQKIHINKVLNREITVCKYRVEDSKFKEQNYDKCLQIELELGGVKHVLFTGSKILTETIQQIPVDNFPFVTTIVEENGRYEFS